MDTKAVLAWNHFGLLPKFPELVFRRIRLRVEQTRDQPPADQKESLLTLY
jgi:hypothetical protein